MINGIHNHNHNPPHYFNNAPLGVLRASPLDKFRNIRTIGQVSKYPRLASATGHSLNRKGNNIAHQRSGDDWGMR